MATIAAASSTSSTPTHPNGPRRNCAISTATATAYAVRTSDGVRCDGACILKNRRCTDANSSDNIDPAIAHDRKSSADIKRIGLEDALTPVGQQPSLGAAGHCAQSGVFPFARCAAVSALSLDWLFRQSGSRQ